MQIKLNQVLFTNFIFFYSKQHFLHKLRMIRTEISVARNGINKMMDTSVKPVIKFIGIFLLEHLYDEEYDQKL